MKQIWIAIFLASLGHSAMADTLVGNWVCQTRPQPENYKLDVEFIFEQNQDYTLLTHGRGVLANGNTLEFSLRLLGTWRLDGKKILEENLASSKFVRFNLNGKDARDSQLAADMAAQLAQEIKDDSNPPMVLTRLKGDKMRIRDSSATLRCSRTNT